MLGAAALCTGLLGAALSATGTRYELSLGSEGRLRTVALPTTPAGGQGGLSRETAAELGVDPAATLLVARENLELNLALQPQLTVSSRKGDTWLLLDRASLSAAWRPDPLWVLSLAARGSYGKVPTTVVGQAGATSAETTPPGGGTGTAPGPTPVAAVTALLYQSAEVSLGATATLSPRARARFGASLGRSGGANGAAQRIIPLLTSGTLSGGGEWDASRRDSLVALGSLLASKIAGTAGAPGATHQGLLLSGSWRRALTPESRTWITAGAEVDAVAGGSLGRSRTAWAPVAEVGVSDARSLTGGHLATSLGVSLAPYLDPLSARLYPRAAATASAALVTSREWAVQAQGAAGVATEGPQSGDWTAVGDVRATRRFEDLREVSLGLRGMDQHLVSTRTRSYEWTIFLSFSLRDRGSL